LFEDIIHDMSTNVVGFLLVVVVVVDVVVFMMR